MLSRVTSICEGAALLSNALDGALPRSTTRFGLSSEEGKYDDVLQRETYIAAEVFHILP